MCNTYAYRGESIKTLTEEKIRYFSFSEIYTSYQKKNHNALQWLIWDTSIMIKKLPVVYMDETGNKESDRFFVCGFLQVPDSEALVKELARVRDQIEAKARYNKQKRVKDVYQQKDIDQLYNFAKSTNSFELKYKHVSDENIRFFKILIKILMNKVDFRFDAIVIDRKDPAYIHRDLKSMYKIITHKYFNYRCKDQCIFIPDNFDDHNWSWSEVLNNQNILSVVPGSSHSLLPLQVVDLLTGIIGHGLKDKVDYTNKDRVREPLVTVFEEEAGMKIKRVVTKNSPKYISIWTLDFSKTKKRSL